MSRWRRRIEEDLDLLDLAITSLRSESERLAAWKVETLTIGPGEAVILAVPSGTSLESVRRIEDIARHRLGCRVLVVSDNVKVNVAKGAA